MIQPRPCAAFLALRAALLAIVLITAVPAFSFVVSAASAAEQEASFAFSDEADELGLGISTVYADNQALFTFFYNATSYGEMKPCPT